MWRQEFGLETRYAGPAVEIIVRLQEALEDTGWDPDVSEIPQAERDYWTFGTAITFRGPPKPILRGFVQPPWREPVLRRVPDLVALYLITLDDREDYLDRERTGWESTTTISIGKPDAASIISHPVDVPDAEPVTGVFEQFQCVSAVPWIPVGKALHIGPHQASIRCLAENLVEVRR